jgi:hypothetical protein
MCSNQQGKEKRSMVIVKIKLKNSKNVRSTYPFRKSKLFSTPNRPTYIISGFSGSPSLYKEKKVFLNFKAKSFAGMSLRCYLVHIIQRSKSCNGIDGK